MDFDYADLSVQIGKMKLRTCLSNESGINSGPPTYLAHLSQDKSLGLLFSKSTSSKPREGYDNPIFYLDPNHIFALNAVGVPCPGVHKVKEELLEVYPLQVPLFNSVFPESPEDSASIVKELYGVSGGFELNLSCPNLKPGEKRGVLIGRESDLTKECVKASKQAAGDKPVIAKLSADVYDIRAIARAAVDGGADGITAINTIGPGMKIDINAMKPVLARKSGGMSGPAIFPITVNRVYEIKEEIGDEAFIIGEGGVSRGVNVIELIQAGADVVGIGTETAYEDEQVYEKIAMETLGWLKEKKLRLDDIRGVSHWRR